jgi:ribosomal protein S18 acetylase RimI-like enzyme
MSELEIREARSGDAAELAKLSEQLGYPIEAEVLRGRLEQFARCKDHTVFVACSEYCVIGWIDVTLVDHLVSGLSGEISGLVVSEEFRGRQIGRKLVERAEQWMAEQGVRHVVVRSRVERERAHRFYLGLNFTRVKTSAVFGKHIN